MNRIHRGATVWALVALTLLASAGVAQAQQVTGRIIGRVVDQDNGAVLSGVTVIVQGPQGEDATITDDKGHYQFSNLGVGVYTIRFYLANTATQVEQPGVNVTAERTVRVNAKIPSTAQAAAQQTYVITGKAPSIDVGSARVGMTFEQDFTLNLALNPDYGSVLSKAPGAFIDPSGNTSIGGATGLENIYVVNGLNVTGLRYGNLEAGQSSLAGGTNLPLEFLQQIDVNSGGYQAEYGGALGGVINTVIKSGTNQFHGSVWTAYAPYWLSADPSVVTTTGSSIAGVRRLDFDTRIGFEVGGPILKDKLFFWAGFAPQINGTHVTRLVYRLDEDGQTELPWARKRLNETRQTYAFAAKVDFIVTPDHKLELATFGTPSFNEQMRSFNNGQELNSEFPSAAHPTTWPQEALTKSNTDVMAHWTSKFYDRRWTLEALAGVHNEYFYNASPDGKLNNLNQLQYWNSDLYTREHIPGCEPLADGTATCPVNPFYSTGGFGQVSKSVGNRWNLELKSSHLIEAGGRHDLKYGYGLTYATFSLNRYYSGPWHGGNGYDLIYPDGTIASQNFFRPQPGQYPVDFGTRFPLSDLVQAPVYQDHIQASVKNITQALYIQDSFNPAPLRNLTINAGVRLDMQKIYDMGGKSFLDSNNVGPRVSAAYDPFNDGRTKFSAGYGRYFQAIPLDIAARYFGGENFVSRGPVPGSACTANPDPQTWTGAGEWTSCGIPPVGSTAGDASGGYTPTFNTALKQSHLQGQFQNEVVATAERQVMEDMTVRLDYTHRWLGTIVEDGYGDASFQTVLANPGNVPAEALADAKREAADAHAAADAAAAAAAADPTNTDLQNAANVAGSQASTAQTKYDSLQTFAAAPKPERTYDALSLTVNKRLAKNWLVRASYTYSRLVGNYQGLYQVEQSYFAPNGSNAYDVPDLYVNSRGRLPNDRPQQFKADGVYMLPVGVGKFTFGLSFSARSGMPRGYISNLLPGQNYQIVQLLPRGSAGRTPMVTQLDAHIAYGRPLTKGTNIEAFIDLFNFLNQQETLQTDDNYTYQAAAPIANGTAKDLAFAKDIFGQPIQKQPNFGRPIAYQIPFYTRMGLRLNF